MFTKYNPQNPSLLESIVCFTDILGFSSLIINTSSLQSGNGLLKDLHKILTKHYEIMREMNPYGHFKTFTDNVILAYPRFQDGEGQSGSLFMSFIDYQLEMTLNGYFLRGGIALGDYYGDDDFAYGPALIEAHDLECSKASYPRIILSNNMVKMVCEHLDYYAPLTFAPQFSHLLKDADGSCFVNYLYGLHEIFNCDDRNAEDLDLYVDQLKKHKGIVEAKLQQFSNVPKLYAKYEWVAQYHNYYCEQYFEPIGIQKLGLNILGVLPRNFSRIVVNDSVNF
ncbi:hypothetical protein [Bacillus altitudinis]|uniref:hypothetical protein n=1 Tax=Bacillus altitudinis TaxID=293387 RepID=UPI001FB83451|nr:hypothetical protein [Bacillus altitudinis]UOG07892.1 hypothetical protein MTX65_01000 [Bacillus altitudinis]